MATVLEGMAEASKIRLWPGVVLVGLQWGLRLLAPVVDPANGAIMALLGGVACGLGVLLWWTFFSRAPLWERLSGAALLIAVPAAFSPLLHPSIATGMMGMLYPIYLVPVLSLALVVWAVLSREWAAGPRRAALAATIALAAGGFALLRTDGITGAGVEGFEWRWSPTAEERLLARTETPPPATVPEPKPEAALEPASKPEPEAAPASGPAVEAAPPPLPAPPAPEWPGFRGPARDGVVRGGPTIATDWAAEPPVELWRRPVGPGWSSFSVQGEYFFTQEQRGEEEIVACYRVATGEPVWFHADKARFWEANAGAGPRATPTLAGGRVYALGATGILNTLDAATGAVVWSRDASADLEQEEPGWGFAGSPLVLGDAVLVALSGKLAAYPLEGGSPRWIGPAGGHAYSSPHLARLGGVEQVLLVSKSGLSGFAPADGRVLWENPWPPKSRIVQPALTPDGDVLFSGGEMTGLRRVAVRHEGEDWKAEERWTSFRMKPYFNDFVVHEGHVYGFDGRLLACVDLEDGERKWKGGRYGDGQMLLLADQDLLLVLSEEGELALVAAAPDGFRELAKVSGIDGKTWNHPVLVGDTLLVRNSEEMAAFRLPVSGR